MLVFIDESYSVDQDGNIHHALAGFGISEESYRKLVAAVHQIKEKYFESAESLSSDQRSELRTKRIACSGEPRRAELKATKLLTSKAAKFHAETKSAQSVLLVNELLGVVQSLDGVVFGVLSEPDHVDQIQNPGQLIPLQLKALIERVEDWMSEQDPGQQATLIFDAIDSRTSRDLNFVVSDFLFRHGQGKRIRRVVPTIFWVDSSSTPGSQVADLIAHVLMNSMLPSDRKKQLDEVWLQVKGMMYRSKSGQMRGIRRLKKKQQTGA